MHYSHYNSQLCLFAFGQDIQRLEGVLSERPSAPCPCSTESEPHASKDNQLVAACFWFAAARHQVQSVASPSSQEGGKVLNLSYGGKVILPVYCIKQSPSPNKLYHHGGKVNRESVEEKMRDRFASIFWLLVDCV